MSFILLTILKQFFQRCRIYRRLNRLERIKVNGVRRKYRLPPTYTTWDYIWDILCCPFSFVFDSVYDFFERIITSIGSRRSKRRINGHMSRVFKNNTEENKLFRKVLYFLFGISLTYLAFLFLYYQHIQNNYPLIGTTIALTLLFALIAPFKDTILCLTLIGLPSMFSSKVRYILLAYVMYSLYFQVVPNIWNNGMDGIQSFGCSVWQTGRGGKKMAGVLVEDIKEFIRDTKRKMREIVNDMKKFFKQFDLNIKLPSLNLKAICNEPTDQDVYKCEDSLTLFAFKAKGAKHRAYLPGICDNLWIGFAKFCQDIKLKMKIMYMTARQKFLELIAKIERELYFDVELNHDFDYHYNTSHEIPVVFKLIGRKFMEKHWLLSYITFLANIKNFIVLIFSLWIIIISIVYRYRFLISDPFDNTYISKELLEIDKKRAASGKETIIPLNINERKHFIYPFDLIMTSIEFKRFIFGLSLFTATLGQVFLYLALDVSVYHLISWYNTIIDIISDIFAPASIKFDFKGDSFFANRLNQLNNGLDVKKKIVENLQECKSIPLPPDGQVYKRILIFLVLTMCTLFSTAYGLRLRHYIAGLFYPHRVPVRAVWLYNNILSRRGNIFQFWRKKMRKYVFGEKTTVEDITFLDRLCAQSPYIRIACKLLGLYGHHKYCQICGLKVKVDGSDQSVRCVHNCGAIYCFDCFGDRSNICSVCMNPIDYTEFGDMSEELDSSEEDVDYNLQNEDYLYQYSDDTKIDKSINDWEEYDPGAFQRRDLVTLAYKYDTVDRVPAFVYLVDNEDYDAEDESEDPEDYQKHLFSLEQELGIPAEHILEMKQNAKRLVAEDMNEWMTNKVKEEKYSQFKREDDQRLVRNALLMVNRDRKKYIKKSRTKLN